MHRNIALTISYDGTDYAGWQIQKNQCSVQETLEKALEDLHQHPISLTGAGRTDAGVHALGQVGNFFTDMDSIPHWRFRDALNVRLPRDIRIIRSSLVGNSFHARREAQSRHYEYRIREGWEIPAHLMRFTWQIPRIPTLSTLNDMALAICGEHDFTSFTASADSSPHRIRKIHSATFSSEGAQVIFRIKGNAFLWRMVRSLIGTMIDTALRGGDATTIKNILHAQNRNAAGPTAPARGLFLARVDYGQKWSLY